MLDLDPGVGLDEVRVAGVVHEELERAEVRETGRPREGEGGDDDPVAKGGIEVGSGRDLDDLLPAPLEAALALAEVDGPAGSVTGHLDLDVPRPRDEALDVELLPAEGAPGLLPAARPRAFELRDAPGGGHPAAAPAPRRFDHHPGAVRSEGEQELAGRREPAFHRGPREDRYLAVLRERPCPGLVAEEIEGVRGRADEGDAALHASPGEVRILAQEPVAGMDGVTARPLRGPDDRLPVEVGGGAPSRERHHLVRARRVQGPRVVLGANRDHGEPQVRRTSRDADRDLPPIRDEDAPESHSASSPSADPNLRSSTFGPNQSNSEGNTSPRLALGKRSRLASPRSGALATRWERRYATAPRPFFATSVSSFNEAPRGRFSPRSHWLTSPVVTLR